MEISSIQFFTSFSTLIATDISGISTVYNSNAGEAGPYKENIDIFTISSITSIDVSGVSSIYGIDISGAKYLSSLKGSRFSLTSLMNSYSYLSSIESKNRDTFNSLDFSQLEKNLHTWASIGFPDSYVAYSFPITSPPKSGNDYLCSDGLARSHYGYVHFFMQGKYADVINSYNEQLHEIQVTVSLWNDPYCLNLHVSR